MTTRTRPPTFGLAPDKQQSALLKRYFGVSRYAYNWVLYANREEKLLGDDLRQRFDEAVAKEAPWVREVPPAITDAAIRQAERDLAFLKGKGRRPRYRRKEDDASVRIDADAEDFKIGQGGIHLPEVGKLSLIGGSSRIGGKVEAVVIVLVGGEDWEVQFLLARGERKDRNDGGRQRDRDLPAWQRRGEGEQIGALPESVQLVREGDDGSTVVITGSGRPAVEETEVGTDDGAPSAVAVEAPTQEEAPQPAEAEPAEASEPEPSTAPDLAESAASPAPTEGAEPVEAPEPEPVAAAEPEPAHSEPPAAPEAPAPTEAAPAQKTGWEALGKWVAAK